MRFINRIAIALLLVTLAGTATLGKSKRKQITFDTAIKVNGTVVKAGSYDVVFDDSANELSILKGGKVVAKTAARLEQRASKARDTRFTRRMEELVSVTFGGSNQDVVVGQAGMQAGDN